MSFLRFVEEIKRIFDRTETQTTLTGRWVGPLCRPSDEAYEKMREAGARFSKIQRDGPRRFS